MSKHTPGSWIAVTYGGKATTQFSIMDDTNEPICSESYAIRPTSEIEANAHLIAAAPDMYEVLQVIVADEKEICEMSGYALSPIFEIAQEALTRAEGKNNE